MNLLTITFTRSLVGKKIKGTVEDILSEFGDSVLLIEDKNGTVYQNPMFFDC